MIVTKEPEMISMAFDIDLNSLLEANGHDTQIDIEEYVPQSQLKQVYTPKYFG